MTRILKAVGLAMTAAAAIAAIMAPAAQAETGVLTAPQYPAILTGEQLGGVTWDIGELPNHEVTCASTLDGTITRAMDPVTFTPTYENCISDPAGTPTTVTTNGCDYTIGFTRPGTTGQPTTTGTMQAWLECPVGQQMEIHVYENAIRHAENVSLCTYDIPAQGPVEAGVYHNRFAMPRDVDLTINAKFTATSTIGPELICGGELPLQHLPIRLTGTYTLRAYQDIGGVEGGQIPVDVG